MTIILIKKLGMKYDIHVKKVFLKITKKNDKKTMYKNTEISDSENIKEYRQGYEDISSKNNKKERQENDVQKYRDTDSENNIKEYPTRIWRYQS